MQISSPDLHCISDYYTILLISNVEACDDIKKINQIKTVGDGVKCLQTVIEKCLFKNKIILVKQC